MPEVTVYIAAYTQSGHSIQQSRGELTLRLTHPVKDELFTVEDVDEFDQYVHYWCIVVYV